MRAFMVVGVAALFTVAVVTQLNDISAYYPIAEGHAWEYAVSKHSVITTGSESRRSKKEGIVSERVTDRASLATAIISRTLSETNSTMNSVTIKSVFHVRAEPSVVAIVAVAVENQPTQLLAVPQPLLRVALPGPLVDGNQSALRFRTRLEKQSATSVEVPAGSFLDCLLAETRGPISGQLNGMPVRSGTIEIKSWYARGVGLVREDRTLHFVISTSDGTSVDIGEVASKQLTRHIAPS